MGGNCSISPAASAEHVRAELNRALAKQKIYERSRRFAGIIIYLVCYP